jgi:hypothetical protein
VSGMIHGSGVKNCSFTSVDLSFRDQITTEANDRGDTITFELACPLVPAFVSLTIFLRRHDCFVCFYSGILWRDYSS